MKTNKGQPYSCHLPDTNQGGDEVDDKPTIDTDIGSHLNYLQDKCLVKVSHDKKHISAMNIITSVAFGIYNICLE